MDNKIIKLIMPLVAVVVIFESIMLVSNLEKNANTSKVADDVTPTITETEKKIETFDVAFLTDEAQMKVGKKYKVSVNLTAKSDVNLNAIDLYVKYDPQMVAVSNLISSKDLSTPNLMKVSDKKNVILLNYLFSQEDGMAFTKDKTETAITFTITPKLEGNSVFEISTGDSEGDSVTMFIDKNTSKALDFSSNKLEVQFIK